MNIFRGIRQLFMNIFRDSRDIQLIPVKQKFLPRKAVSLNFATRGTIEIRWRKHFLNGDDDFQLVHTCDIIVSPHETLMNLI